MFIAQVNVCPWDIHEQGLIPLRDSGTADEEEKGMGGFGDDEQDAKVQVDEVLADDLGWFLPGRAKVKR